MNNISFAFYNKTGFFLVLFILLGMTSCIKEDIKTNNSTTTLTPQELLTTTIYGRILDENNNPINSAMVSYKSGAQLEMIETDEDGYFFLRNVHNKGKSAFLTVQHEGKFEAFRRLSVVAKQFNYTEIKMNNRTIIGSLSTAVGGSLTHTSGAKITFPSDGIVDQNGDLYNGNFDVAMSWIDPSAEDLSQRMVGDLSGIDAEGRIQSLGTFGMLQVELLGNNERELNLADGSEATLEFPVPVSLQGKAPDVIPLWSYDETQGTWIQEGEATYNNGMYTGTVTHFSSWNVDCIMDPIEISGQVIYELPDDETYHGSYLQIQVCGEKFGRKGGWLCNNGDFLFYNFPKDEEFELKILNHCGEIIYHADLGPYTENTDLGEINVESSTETIVVTGNAIDCDGNPITNGIISVAFDQSNYLYPVNVDGTFQFTIDICSGSPSLTLINLDEQLTSSPISINNSQSVWNFTDLSVCDELIDFIAINISGISPVIYTPNINFSVQDTSSFINYSTESPDGYAWVDLNFEEPTAENVPFNVNWFTYSFSDNTQYSTYYYLSSSDNMTITFSNFNNVPGGEVRGTFQGTVTEELTGSQNNISGSFHVPIE